MSISVVLVIAGQLRTEDSRRPSAPSITRLHVPNLCKTTKVMASRTAPGVQRHRQEPAPCVAKPASHADDHEGIRDVSADG
jgi:hypothetical protein